QDLAELRADVLNLGLVELGVEQVEHLILALEADLPDLTAGLIVMAVLVDDQALAHEDEAEDETEVELGGLGRVGEALEELAEDFVVDEELFLLLDEGHRRLPEADQVGLVEVGPV